MRIMKRLAIIVLFSVLLLILFVIHKDGQTSFNNMVSVVGNDHFSSLQESVPWIKDSKVHTNGNFIYIYPSDSAIRSAIIAPNKDPPYPVIMIDESEGKDYLSGWDLFGESMELLPVRISNRSIREHNHL